MKKFVMMRRADDGRMDAFLPEVGFEFHRHMWCFPCLRQTEQLITIWCASRGQQQAWVRGKKTSENDEGRLVPNGRLVRKGSKEIEGGQLGWWCVDMSRFWTFCQADTSRRWMANFQRPLDSRHVTERGVSRLGSVVPDTEVRQLIGAVQHRYGIVSGERGRRHLFRLQWLKVALKLVVVDVDDGDDPENKQAKQENTMGWLTLTKGKSVCAKTVERGWEWKMNYIDGDVRRRFLRFLMKAQLHKKTYIILRWYIW